MQDELAPNAFPHLAAIRSRREVDEREMRAWLDSLRDDDGTRRADGEARRPTYTLADYLLHILFHARKQHVDIATLSTLEGRSPGELEFLEFRNDH